MQQAQQTKTTFRPNSVLITGSNRGIGLEFVKYFVQTAPAPTHVFAACRNPDKAQDLQELQKKHKSITIIKIVADDLSTLGAAKATVEEKVKGEGLNLLINNAGVMMADKVDTVTAEMLMESYAVNTVGPIMIAQNFLPLLKIAAKKTDGPMSCSRAAIVNISTGLASIADNQMGGYYAYRCSKAGLNMATKGMGMDLKEAGILLSSIQPGWVKTGLGGDRAPLTTEQSVGKMMKTISTLQGPDATGKFFEKDGAEVGW